MLALKLTLALFGILVVVQTALSLVRSRAWWVRIFDFPRAQIMLLSTILLALLGLANLGNEQAQIWEWVLLTMLGLAVAVQLRQMLPYSRAWKRQVPDASPGATEESRLRVVISNVQMENRSSQRWLEVIRGANPHVILTVEVNDWWDDELRALDRDYPHSVRHPQNNTYGLAVYSRFPLHRTRIKHLVESNVPSIFTSVELPSGRRVRCVVLHPRPPRPDIQQDSDLRDAELVRVANIVRSFHSPVVVAGDLNDVAWSHTTHLFQRIARLLDPRIGRGIFATYHADHRLLRYPLDHIFHSKHFDLAALRRLDHVGSDHYPIFVELALRDEPGGTPQLSPADDADEEEAIDAILDARDLRESETQHERRERQLADR